MITYEGIFLQIAEQSLPIFLESNTSQQAVDV